MHHATRVAGEVHALGPQVVALLRELAHVDRVGRIGTCRHVHDLGVGYVDAARGHARAAGNGQAVVVDRGVARGHRGERRVVRHLEIDRTRGRISHRLQVRARVGASRRRRALDCQGLAQVTMHHATRVAGEVHALGGQVVALLRQLVNVHRVATVHAGRHVPDAGAADLGGAVIGVAAQSHAVMGAVVIHHRIGGGPAKLRHVDGIGPGRACGHSGDLTSLSIGHIAYADSAQGALPGSTGIGGGQFR
ncbi:hypothetical protein D9M69_444360 [compost metagenome]